MVEKQIFGQTWYEEITSLSTYVFLTKNWLRNDKFSPSSNNCTLSLNNYLSYFMSVFHIMRQMTKMRLGPELMLQALT